MLVINILLIVLTVLLFILILRFIFKVKMLKNKLNESESRYFALKKGHEKLVNKMNEEGGKDKGLDPILIRNSRLTYMGEMISNIGHQWQQPLNSLSLLIQDVREALQFGEINDAYIEQFTKESMNEIKHLSRTINDFRKFYQPDKEKRNFSITDSIENALSIFSFSLKNQDIHVHFEYREKRMVYGYSNEYSHVVLNILINACSSFVTNNVKDRKLDIQIRSENRFIVVDFTINVGDVQHIDLEMSKFMIENMDGTFTEENTVGGRRFSLSIPIAAPEKLSPPVTV